MGSANSFPICSVSVFYPLCSQIVNNQMAHCTKFGCLPNHSFGFLCILHGSAFSTKIVIFAVFFCYFSFYSYEFEINKTYFIYYSYILVAFSFAVC